jgi:arsenate reductase
MSQVAKMLETVTIYHNPRCSKSREALAILKERGIEPEVIEYLECPPTPAEFRRLVSLLQTDAHALLRTKETQYAEQGLTRESSLDDIAHAVERAPILLERPVVVVGDRAVIGRPPSKVLEII